MKRTLPGWTYDAQKRQDRRADAAGDWWLKEHGKKKKRKKGRKHPNKRAHDASLVRERDCMVQDANAAEDDVRRQAWELGELTLDVSHFGKRRRPHWMFNTSAGRRVLDYWPSSGTVWCAITDEKAKVDRPIQAMYDAQRVAQGGKLLR